MSEYQYYEFQAIDRPLTEEEQAAMRRISHRVDLTPIRAVFTYSFGDFQGNPKAVLAQHFDAMLYVANWGSKQLKFRFPSSLIDLDRVGVYGDWLEHHVTWSIAGDYAILDISFAEEGGTGWIEAERWLSSLVPLRKDILRGDYRLLYLAWVRSLTPEDAEEPLDEPPVPPGLRELSPALEAFVELFEVDPFLLQVAAQASGDLAPVAGDDLRRAIAVLSRAECDAILLRLAQGEAHLEVVLGRRLSETIGQPDPGEAPRRTIAQLLGAAGEARRQEEARRAQEAEAKRITELEDLAGREEQAWELVETLIGKKQPRPYDEAVQLLLKLREAASYKGREAAFEERLGPLCARVRTRHGLLARLRGAGLI